MKKIICLALIACLLLATFVSCNSADDEPLTTEETTSFAVESEKKEEDKKTEDKKKDDGKKEEDKKPSGGSEVGGSKENKNLLIYTFSDKDLEGCNVQSAKTTVANGTLTLVCDETHNGGTEEKARFDPKINICPDDLPLTGADYDVCEIRCRYDVSERTTHKTSTLFFWFGENSADFYYIEYIWENESSGEEWVTVRFDLSEMLLWKNFPIYQIRWDPFECVGTCEIDYIAFYDGELEIGEDDIPKDTTKPSIDSISNGSIVEKNSSFTLSVEASGGALPYTYSWSDGTSIVGTEASVTLTKAEAGTYNYTCTVTDANGNSVTSKGVEVLVASNYKAYNFDTDANNEGWASNGVLGTAIVRDGAYYLVSDTPNGTRYDPQLTLSGVNMNGSDYTKCIVTYKFDFGNATKDYQATLFAWGNGGTILSKEVMPNVTATDEYITIVFDLASWNGHTISKIRFDVCECAGTAYIDSIVFAG